MKCLYPKVGYSQVLAHLLPLPMCSPQLRLCCTPAAQPRSCFILQQEVLVSQPSSNQTRQDSDLYSQQAAEQLGETGNPGSQRSNQKGLANWVLPAMRFLPVSLAVPLLNQIDKELASHMTGFTPGNLVGLRNSSFPLSVFSLVLSSSLGPKKASNRFSHPGCWVQSQHGSFQVSWVAIPLSRKPSRN